MVVTVTLTVPVPEGDVAVIWVGEFTVKLVAAVVPNFTALAPAEAGAGDGDRAWPRPGVGPRSG